MAYVARLAGTAAQRYLFFGRLGQVGGPADDQATLRKSSGYLLLEVLFDRSQLQARLENPIGQLRQTFLRAGDATNFSTWSYHLAMSA
jgi:hypothetical protein